MATPVHTPRINNNDDQVKLIALEIAVGDQIERGQVLGQVETDKAVVDLEADRGGFVLAVQAEVEQMVEVGSVLIWLGETADEAVPEARSFHLPVDGGHRVSTATAGARILLQRHGLSTDQVPASGPRLQAADVEAFLARGGGNRRTPQKATPIAEPEPEVAGQRRPLTPEQRGMLQTVSWSQQFAVPGYLELEYDPEPWERHAAKFADQHRLMLSPLLTLMAHRLVDVAGEHPEINATIVGEERLEYDRVNLGFTVQAGEVLYLAVLREADGLDEKAFLNGLGELQRRAAGHKLSATETQGATISFSCMARWKVNRHVPVLPPHTAMIIAHAAGADGRAVLGASYDHRVLNGFQVIRALRKLSKPGNTEH